MTKITLNYDKLVRGEQLVLLDTDIAYKVKKVRFSFLEMHGLRKLVEFFNSGGTPEIYIIKDEIPFMYSGDEDVTVEGEVFDDDSYDVAIVELGIQTVIAGKPIGFYAGQVTLVEKGGVLFTEDIKWIFRKKLNLYSMPTKPDYHRYVVMLRDLKILKDKIVRYENSLSQIPEIVEIENDKVTIYVGDFLLIEVKAKYPGLFVFESEFLPKSKMELSYKGRLLDHPIFIKLDNTFRYKLANAFHVQRNYEKCLQLITSLIEFTPKEQEEIDYEFKRN